MKLEMKRPALSKNNQYILLLFGAVIIFIFTILTVVMPLRQDNQKDGALLITKRQQLAAYQTFSQQNRDYDTFAAAQRLKLQRAQLSVPDQVSIPDVLRDYSGKAEHAGIAINNIKTPAANQIVKDGNAFAVPLQVKLSGNYYKIVDFLQEMEHGERFAKLQQVNITGNEKNGDLKVDAQLTVYALKKELKGTSSKPAGQTKATGQDLVRQRDKANMEMLEGKK